MKAANPNFDDGTFLDGAGEAFEIILAAFAKGDKRELRGLLDDTTYQSFVDEIERREGAGERLETTLVSVKDAVITEAQMAGLSARVTVKFASEQVNVTYNEADEVVAGDASRVANINDVWTFARDVRSRDPNWQLVGTRAVD
jgi:predicted lipid-binding transport protein (Tim44 family)